MNKVYNIKNMMRVAHAYVVTTYKLGVIHRTTLPRLEMLDYAMQYVKGEQVKGEYFEFGVARGLSFISAYHLGRKYQVPIKTFYGFDSFEGFPEIKGVDKKFERFTQGQESWEYKVFTDNLVKAKVNIDRLHVRKGWFKDTLTKSFKEYLKQSNEKASVIFIDCDLYQSTREVLTFIPDLIQNGTILMFDDWYCYRADPTKGEQRAVSEFLKKNKHIQLIPYKRFGLCGNSFIAHIKGNRKV